MNQDSLLFHVPNGLTFINQIRESSIAMAILIDSKLNARAQWPSAKVLMNIHILPNGENEEKWKKNAKKAFLI